jgi:hypothetical protein
MEHFQMKDIFIKFSTVLLILGTLFGARALAQSPLDWKTAQKFDNGVETTVAVTPSGLVVEFHKTQNKYSNDIHYRIGKVGQAYGGQYLVSWGASQPLGKDGSRPSVAITKEGSVVLVYTKGAYTGYGNQVQMRYWVGQLDPTGDTKQEITWRVKDAFYDTGQHASLSFNTNDVLVDTHESANNSKLFYRIGHLLNPSQGQFDIVWNSGTGGIEYDKGIHPSIAINQSNQVIEVHQTEKTASYLHYRRGTLGTDRIVWASNDSVRYENDSKQPAVALTNHGLAVEAAIRNRYTFSRTGILNVPDPTRVDWSNAVQIDWGTYAGMSPSITTNGVVAIATWESDDWLFYNIAAIK